MIAQELKQNRLLRKQLIEKARLEGSDFKELEKLYKSSKASIQSSIGNRNTKSSSVSSYLYNTSNRIKTQQIKKRSNKIPNLIKRISKTLQVSIGMQKHEQVLKLTKETSCQNRENLHSNFVDLNPIYHQQRHQRAVKLADYMLKAIKESLKMKVEEKAREIFNERIQNGLKLTYLELQNLKSDWKSDYIKQQLIEDEEVKKYATNVQRNADNVHEDNVEAIMEIEDLEQQWEDHNREFSELIDKKATECGIVNRKDLKHYFQEFDILDMYLDSDEKCQKIKCKACQKGIKCLKHQLQKRDIALAKDQQFKGRDQILYQTKLKPLLK